MLHITKRVNKCIYYLLNFKDFENKICTILWFKDFISFLKTNFSDLEMSWNEVEAFYCGLKSDCFEEEFKNKPEYLFYLAGRKNSKK